jgi:hypothetical protein
VKEDAKHARKGELVEGFGQEEGLACRVALGSSLEQGHKEKKKRQQCTKIKLDGGELNRTEDLVRHSLSLCEHLMRDFARLHKSDQHSP